MAVLKVDITKQVDLAIAKALEDAGKHLIEWGMGIRLDIERANDAGKRQGADE